jgi:hypothetical protein
VADFHSVVFKPGEAQVMAIRVVVPFLTLGIRTFWEFSTFAVAGP